jgi:hypothetical protein
LQQAERIFVNGRRIVVLALSILFYATLFLAVGSASIVREDRKMRQLMFVNGAGCWRDAGG